MLLVVTGGAASGKSAHAEQLLVDAAPGDKCYLATMEPFGPDAAFRIDRHRALRAGKGFETIERYTNLAGLRLPKSYDGVLLECLSNLLANELFSPVGAGTDGAKAAVLDGIDALARQCRTLVVVTNEVFSDGLPYDADTLRYIRLLGESNQALCARADRVCESVCGILCTRKGIL